MTFFTAPEIEYEIHQDTNKEQHYTFIGSMRLFKGCQLWSFDPRDLSFKRVHLSGEVEEAVRETKAILSLADIVLQRRSSSRSFGLRANFDPNCIYVLAVNAKNAARKINKHLPKGTQILVKKDYGPGKR